MGENRRFGKYLLLEELGRGAMGAVWKATDTVLARTVALKFILADAEDRAAFERFVREAKVAARLRHPNIAQIYEIGEEAGRTFLALEYIDGRDLADGAIEPREAIRILRDVARAVDHAHREGVVHRDLKPENILVSREGTPYVTDFGLAKSIGVDRTLTLTGDVLGTPAFMSPEQAAGKTRKVGPLSDVYSLGATLYGLLTGSPPFDEPTPMLTARAVLETLPRRPRTRDSSIPPAVEAICLRAMARDPERRYPTAGALADDCERWLAGRPIEARIASTTQTTRRRKRPRHSLHFRLVQAAIFASPVVLLALVAAIRFLGRETPIVVAEAPPATPDPAIPEPVPEEPVPVDPPIRPPIEPTPAGRARCDRAREVLEGGLAGLYRRDLDPVAARAPIREALRLLDELVGDEPDLPDARRLRARARSILLDPRGAIEDLTVVLAGRPDDVEARFDRGRERFRLHCRRMLLAGAWWERPALWPDRSVLDEARSDLERVVDRAAGTLRERARAYQAFAAGDPRLCRATLDDLVASGTADEEVHFLRALALHWMARSTPGLGAGERKAGCTQAVAAYQSALAARWHFFEGWVLLSVALGDLGHLDQAIGNLAVGRTVYPGDPLVHSLLAEMHLTAARNHAASGRTEEARAHEAQAASAAETALAIDPDGVVALLVRAHLRSSRGEHAPALGDVERSLAANARSVRAHALAAGLHLQLHRPAQALAAADRAIELRDDAWDVYVARGVAHQSLGHGREARSDYERALSLAPPGPTAEAIKARLKQLR